jgi:hypothetical protein
MKGTPVDELVYETMFPKATRKSNDPQDFRELLRLKIVQEVRSETAIYYGSLESREAQYPGLDYSHPPHRMRLSRFKYHRMLFRAFDALGLTRSEIAGLTKWEGTRWAKERFEKEQGTIIRDTTGDCIHDWVEPENRRRDRVWEEMQVEEKAEAAEEEDTDDMDEDGEESDMEVDSVGVELNERLRAAAASREAGYPTTVMDEEWEEWLKDAAEAGGMSSSLAGHLLRMRQVPLSDRRSVQLQEIIEATSSRGTELPVSAAASQQISSRWSTRLRTQFSAGTHTSVEVHLVQGDPEAESSLPTLAQLAQQIDHAPRDPLASRATLRPLNTSPHLNVQPRQPLTRNRWTGNSVPNPQAGGPGLHRVIR